MVDTSIVVLLLVATVGMNGLPVMGLNGGNVNLQTTLKRVTKLDDPGHVGDIQVITREMDDQTDATSSPLRVGWINSTTGDFQRGGSLPLPEVPSTCGNPTWKFGGTNGQGYTVFFQNRSFYFFAQLSCNNVPTENLLLQTFITSYYDPRSPDPMATRIAARFNSSAYAITPFERWNVAWDWVCNFIVLAPNNLMNGDTIFETLMISEYDGAVRRQKDFFVEKTRSNTETGWVKVNGLGVVDFDGESTGGPYELNCGLTCKQYAIEAQMINGQQIGARRLIGRMFHTAVVASNVTDSVQAQTMSYYSTDAIWETAKEEYLAMNPTPSQSSDSFFVGLGICCEDKWCAKECMGHAGSLILFGYNGGNSDMIVLAVLLNADSATTQEVSRSVQLGVQVISYPFWSRGSVYATMVVKEAVVVYLIERSDSGMLTAKHHSTSPSTFPPNAINFVSNTMM